MVCCLNEDERNSWLSKILHAKAISLVNDRSWVNERQRSGSEGSTDSCPERSTVKEVLHRCKRKLSLGSNRASYSLEEFCRSRARTNLNSHWRNTLMDISLVTWYQLKTGFEPDKFLSVMFCCPQRIVKKKESKEKYKNTVNGETENSPKKFSKLQTGQENRFRFRSTVQNYCIKCKVIHSDCIADKLFIS